MYLYELVLDKARQLRSEIVEFERELIKIPSPNPPGEYQQISKCVLDKLKEAGFAVSIVGPSPEKPNVIGRLKGSVGSPVLIQCAHLDTVPVGGGWTVDPYQAIVRDEKIFGRGAYDAKARIVVYIMAARIIEEMGFRLKGDLVGCYTIDEETSGEDGARYCAEKGYLKGDAAILEGRQDEIWFAESGHVTLVLTVFGQASHAMYPWLGVNAIDKITEVLLELQGLQEELKEERSIIPGLSHSTINVGVIKGGTKSNVVPDSCSIDIDLRVIPEVDIAQVIGKIEKILENLSRKDPGFKAELKILMKAEPSMTPSDTPIIEVIKRVCRGLLGFEPLPVGLHADSDGKYFRNQGIPSIHWGVGTAENRGHAADEFIEIKDLVELSAAHALVCMEFLGYETEK